MTLTDVTSVSQLDKLLSSSGTKITIIDFHATWCGPCHAIAPTYESLSKQYSNVNFFKCDVDKAPDVAQRFRVSAMPTFVFLKGSVQVDQVRGADKTGLENMIRKHATAGAGGQTSFVGGGQTLGGRSASTQSTSTLVTNSLPKLFNLEPQVQVLLGLVGAYLVLWYLS